jgi:hypothetical protein
MVTRGEQVDRYRADSFLIIDDVLSTAQVEEGRRLIHEFTERARVITISDALFDIEPCRTAERLMVRTDKPVLE